MNKELKAKWVAALRSGEYQQGIGDLRTEDNKFCCLGVLREIIEPGSNKAAFTANLLREEHLDKSGLSPNEEVLLASMNDGGKKFPEIADYIEKHL